MRAHPHGCGEHMSHCGPRFSLCGSSPRVWGTLAKAWEAPKRLGLIPTGVGNTFHYFYFNHSSGAHPHGCGEHLGKVPRISVGRGSSPRVWGTPHPLQLLVRLRGLIPTGVGNTFGAGLAGFDVGAHPHGCGEHLELGDVQLLHSGSSPRVWGTH